MKDRNLAMRLEVIGEHAVANGLSAAPYSIDEVIALVTKLENVLERIADLGRFPNASLALATVIARSAVQS